MRRLPRLLASLFLLTAGSSVPAADLPVDVKLLESLCEERTHFNIENFLTLEQVFDAVEDGPADLLLDLSRIDTLLDGSVVDPSRIYGIARIGPYPFESAESRFAYKRFRVRKKIRAGQTELGARILLEEHANSEGWTDGGTIALRLELRYEEEGIDRDLGMYDTFVSFRRTGRGFEKLPTIVEGPFLGLVRSGDPGRVTVGFRTSEPVAATVVLDDGRRFESTGGTARHEIEIDGLLPESEYRYRVEFGGESTRSYSFRSAPERGAGSVTFAYTGDTREGRGGGTSEVMGVNYRTTERLVSIAFREGARFLIMGGDLVNGYTSSRADFFTQIHAWKQAVSGFWNTRPIYPIMGNHDALLRVFDEKEGGKAYFDRWPYETESAEAVFADEFLNPLNGPVRSDSRRPTYKENVYSFQHGPVLCIGFNNNYWVTRNRYEAGGSPEGYILDDQLRWIEETLRLADEDRSVRYVLLYAQEPVFPNGGHACDAMWWNGDNTVRAGTYRNGRVEREKEGIVEVRNRFARIVARSPKVAAVLGSDEHGYSRVLIGPEVPVGAIPGDDLNGDGRIDWPAEPCSPLSDLSRNTWYLVGAGGGAPYYSEERTSWNGYWREKGDRSDGFYLSSQENILIFHADERGISLRVLNIHGEAIDRVENLMERKPVVRSIHR